MTTLIEGTHPGGFLVWEAFRDYTRETVTVAAGTLEPGTVLGRITASGKYAAHDPAAVDGTETAVAVLWGKADAERRRCARRRRRSRPRHRQPPRPRLHRHADRGRDRGRPCGAPRRGHPRPLIPRADHPQLLNRRHSHGHHGHLRRRRLHHRRAHPRAREHPLQAGAALGLEPVLARAACAPAPS